MFPFRNSNSTIRRAPTGPRSLINPHPDPRQQEYKVVLEADEDQDEFSQSHSRSPHNWSSDYPPRQGESVQPPPSASPVAYTTLLEEAKYMNMMPSYGADEKTPRTAVDPNASEPFLPKYDPTRRAPSPPAGLGSRLPFERPDWKRIALYITICLLSWPFLRLVTFLANHKSIFWARFIVALGSGALGYGLAILLLEFAKRYLEAATWATVIHLSKGSAEGGILLRDLTRFTTERTSMYTAIWLLMDRFGSKDTNRKARSSYDRRPWSLFILFYLFIICFSSSLPFIFGRIIIIDPVTAQQDGIFDETIIWGDLSASDMQAASNLRTLFTKTVQWTLAPFASLTDYPPSVSFQYGNDTIYFAEAYSKQLRTDGKALGTFALNDTANGTRSSLDTDLNSTSTAGSLPSLVQFPKWGIRIYCASLPDPQTYLVPMSQDGFTYIFVPDFFVKSLFANLSLPEPTLTAKNLSSVLSANDSLPSGANASSIVMAGQFTNNGATHSFFSSPTDMGGSGGGWVEIETVLIRMNNSATPNGSFALYGDADPFTGSRIGYDSAVCVEAYEPYITEVFNSTGVSPSTTRIVNKGAVIEDSDLSPAGAKRRNRISSDFANTVQRKVNSTGKFDAFVVAHDNSVDQMVKDNGRDMWYVPSPLAVSFTDGSGPTGYTKLSPERFAEARAMADATNVLPFLAGTGAVVARLYPSHIISVASVDTVPMVIANVAILILGLIAGLCVPRLPLAVPRRGFDLMSWLAVLYGDNVVGQLPILPGSHSSLNQRVAVEDVDRRLGDVRIKYKV